MLGQVGGLIQGSGVLTSAASKTFFSEVVGFTLTVHAARKIIHPGYEDSRCTIVIRGMGHADFGLAHRS